MESKGSLNTHDGKIVLEMLKRLFYLCIVVEGNNPNENLFHILRKVANFANTASEQGLEIGLSSFNTFDKLTNILASYGFVGALQLPLYHLAFQKDTKLLAYLETSFEIIQSVKEKGMVEVEKEKLNFSLYLMGASGFLTQKNLEHLLALVNKFNSNESIEAYSFQWVEIIYALALRIKDSPIPAKEKEFLTSKLVTLSSKEDRRAFLESIAFFFQEKCFCSNDER
jgi:hypothetical protein